VFALYAFSLNLPWTTMFDEERVIPLGQNKTKLWMILAYERQFPCTVWRHKECTKNSSRKLE